MSDLSRNGVLASIGYRHGSVPGTNLSAWITLHTSLDECQQTLATVNGSVTVSDAPDLATGAFASAVRFCGFLLQERFRRLSQSLQGVDCCAFCVETLGDKLSTSASITHHLPPRLFGENIPGPGE